jgi:hypothetical protein
MQCFGRLAAAVAATMGATAFFMWSAPSQARIPAAVALPDSVHAADGQSLGWCPCRASAVRRARLALRSCREPQPVLGMVPVSRVGREARASRSAVLPRA